MPPVFVLQQTSPAPRQFAIPQEGLRLGRKSDNAVQIHDSRVSRHHATVWIQAGQAFIRDEDTTNGTIVRGQRIPPRTAHPLQAGDEICIGNATFVLAVAQSAPVVVQRARGSPLSTSAYVMGGVVLVAIVLILLIGSLAGRGMPAIRVTFTLTPTRSATQPPVARSATPTRPATATPTIIPTPLPTATSLPSPTQVIVSSVTPSNVLSLLEPADGSRFGGGSAYILLRWKSERSLASGEIYLVTLDCQRPASLPQELGRTDQTQWQAPAHVYDVLTDARQCKWWVNIATSAGSPISPPSATWTFIWEKEKESQPVSTPKIDK